jgi:hypothetical protein
LIIGLVFLLGVGVSTQALMFPDVTELDYDLIKNVFYPPYFVIGGEYYKLDDMLNGKRFLIDNFNHSKIKIEHLKYSGFVFEYKFYS